MVNRYGLSNEDLAQVKQIQSNKGLNINDAFYLYQGQKANDPQLKQQAKASWFVWGFNSWKADAGYELAKSIFKSPFSKE